MKNIKTLRSEALKTAIARGHRILLAPVLKVGKGYLQQGHCLECGMGIYLNSHPSPNNIDISGKAVALECPQTYEQTR